MTHFSITIDIHAPPDRVWAVMRDIERWPEWTASVTSVTPLDGGPLAIGARARIRQPRLLPAVWRVTSLQDGSSFAWETRSPGVCVTARHWVEPAPGGSRATLALEFSGLFGPLVARLTRDLNQRYLALEASGLKQRSERAL